MISELQVRGNYRFGDAAWTPFEIFIYAAFYFHEGIFAMGYIEKWKSGDSIYFEWIRIAGN